MTSVLLAFRPPAQRRRSRGGCRIVMTAGRGARLCLGIGAAAPARAASASNHLPAAAARAPDRRDVRA